MVGDALDELRNLVAVDDMIGIDIGIGGQSPYDMTNLIVGQRGGDQQRQ